MHTERLKLKPKRRAISSFPNIEIAERAITNVMKAHAMQINARGKSGASRLIISKDMGSPAGYGVIRKTGKLISLSKVQVVLENKTYNNMPYYILTAYLIDK